MTDDLRTRIAAALRDHDADMDGANPAHDADDDYGCCADAVMAVVNTHGPDDLDQYIREQAASSPEFAAAYVEAQSAAKVRELGDLLAAIYLYVSWPQVTTRLTTEQKDLWADAVDADWARTNAADPAIGLGTVPRWWRQ